jgi:uncharacterized NAD-dependent epimerase/dehydratase family protein
VRDVGTAAVLIHLESNRIFELNATGSRIWALLEQGVDRDAICARLQEEFDIPAADVVQAVDDLLADLTRERLICG